MFLRGMLIALISVNCFAGQAGQDGGGGDLRKPEYSSAWFLGQKTVNYCIDMSPVFPMSKRRVVKTVKETIGAWNDYIEDRNINHPAPYDIRANIATNYHLQKECDESTDLRFIFGKEDSVVTKVKSTYSNPQAFAHRLSYDMDKGWSKGIIWLRSNGGGRATDIYWNHGFNLEAILLHEFGHVLGNQHMEDTIMTGDIASLIERDIYHSERPSIEMGKYIVENKSQEVLHSGVISTSNDEANEVFHKLTGRAPHGKPAASLYIERRDDVADKYFYILFDDLATFEMEIDIIPNSVRETSNKHPMFKRVYNSDAGSILNEGANEFFKNVDGVTTRYHSSKYKLYSGVLKSSVGTEYLLNFEDNLDKNYFDRNTFKENSTSRYKNLPIQIWLVDKFQIQRILGPSSHWRRILGRSEIY